MSFVDLKAARKAKSYVQSPNRPPESSAAEKDVEQTETDKNLPGNIEIRTTAASGRGLYSKERIGAGSVILAAKPHTAALSIKHLETHCSACFGPSASKKCTQCRQVYYCDATCQKNDWPLHKDECISLQNWRQKAPSPDLAVPSDAVRCLGRILRKRQKKGPDHPWTKAIDTMQSHRATLKPSAFELHTNLSHALVQYIGATSPADLASFGLSSAGDLLDLISRFVTNTFSVTDPALSPLGASVSPLVALINHSCSPNAVVVFPRASPKRDEPCMQVVAIRDISPDEEILTSYIDTTLPRELRQKELLETYNFECRCTLCASDEPDPRESVWCPKSCGGTCPLPKDDTPLSRCSKCKAVLKNTDAVIDAARVGQEALDKATALQFKDPTKSQQLTTNLIQILEGTGVTPSSHPLLALSRLHQSLLISSFPDPLTQEYLDETIRVCTKTHTGLSTILPRTHPVVGISLVELGKLLAVDEPNPPQAPTPERKTYYPPSGPARLKLAYDTLLQARTALLVGFGKVNEGGEVGREVREVLVRLEKEKEVWKGRVRDVLQDVGRK